MSKAPSYDCQRCGACCCNVDENRESGFVDYVEVQKGDELLKRPRMLRRLAIVNDKGETHMKLDHHQRCVALEGRVGRMVGCGIYKVRPSPCRAVQAGSAECIKARRERGVGATA